MRPYILSETNWKTVKKQTYDLAILPWAATEAHNYHLPYSTDIIEAEHISAEAARLAWEQGAKVIVLPVIPFGVNTGQLDIKLDINMNPSTQAAVLRDIVDSLLRSHIFKLLILNSHGGNDFKPLIREIGAQFPKMLLCTCDWFRSLSQEDFFENPDDHAGEMETSLLLYLNSNLVRPLNDAGDGQSRKFRIDAFNEGWAWTERKWSQVTADTGVGDPRQASKEKGERFFTDVTEKVSELLIALAKIDKNDMYETGDER
jgi:creatinine amidohydrolase